MADDPKKKKLDRKRIALKQEHEIEYLRKIARTLIKIKSPLHWPSATSIQRLAKAFLKITEKKK